MKIDVSAANGWIVPSSPAALSSRRNDVVPTATMRPPFLRAVLSRCAVSAEMVVRRLREVRERHALDAPVVLLVRRGDDSVIFADEGATPQTKGGGLRQRAGLITVDGEGANELIIERLRRALAHLLIEVAVGLTAKHVPIEALTILLRQPLKGLMEEDKERILGHYLVALVK